MHFPINISIGKIIIPVHLLCESLAYVFGYRYYAYLQRKKTDQISQQNRLIILIAAAAGAFLGSHIVGTLENPLLLSRVNLVYIMGNTTIVGGLLGGLLCVELVKKNINVKVSSGDMMVYPLILAMIIGRTGCFLAGLQDGTYGVATNLPWGINFGDGIYRHPTNLYEIVFLALLWIVLRLTEKQHEFVNGGRFKLFMIFYLLFRLFIEFIKPDYFFDFGLSVIQITCLLGLAYYYKSLLKPTKLFEHYA